MVIAGLTNGYADYTVTPEEYQQQRYEGGSTIFGPLQLQAYTQELLRLCDALADGSTPQSDPPPVDFSSHLLATGPKPKAEAPPPGKAFGDVLVDAPAVVSAGATMSVTFIGGNLNNDLRLQDTFLRVERQLDGASSDHWALVAEDGDAETRLSVRKDGGLLSKKHNEVTVRWDVPSDATSGMYRIRHQGAYWHDPLVGAGHAVAYEGSSSPFQVRR